MQNFPEYGISDNNMNYAMAQAVGQHPSHNLNVNDMIANDGLNEEIKKLLAEQANWATNRYIWEEKTWLQYSKV